MVDESAWLIERADPRNPGAVLSNSFLGIQGSFGGTLRWMDNAHDALRFARKKDAAMFIGAIAKIMDDLPHCDTLEGLRSSGGPHAIPTEHSWTDARESSV